MLALVLSLALSAPALSLGGAKKSTVTLTPKSMKVKLNASFHFTASGFDASPANFLAAFQTEPVTGCPKKYKKALKAYNHGAAAYLGGTSLTPGSTFTHDYQFKAQNLGKHFLCVYLINKNTKSVPPTYAHAKAHWKVTH